MQTSQNDVNCRHHGRFLGTLRETNVPQSEQQVHCESTWGGSGVSEGPTTDGSASQSCPTNRPTSLCLTTLAAKRMRSGISLGDSYPTGRKGSQAHPCRHAPSAGAFLAWAYSAHVVDSGSALVGTAVVDGGPGADVEGGSGA